MPTENKVDNSMRCVVCGAKFIQHNPFAETCGNEDCKRMNITGESMEDLVREESQMPRDIPDNNHDYDDFDLDKMMERSPDEFRY